MLNHTASLAKCAVFRDTDPDIAGEPASEHQHETSKFGENVSSHRNGDSNTRSPGSRPSPDLEYQRWFPSEAPHDAGTQVVENSWNLPEHSSLSHEENYSVSTNIGDSVLRKVVTNGKDALNLLFEAARKETSQRLDSQTDHTNTTESGFNREMQQPSTVSAVAASTASPSRSTLYGTVPAPCAMSVNLSTDVVETWKAYRFVTTGWMSAQEAVTYVDL